MFSFTKQERLVMAILLAVFIGGSILRLAVSLSPEIFRAAHFLDSPDLPVKVDINKAATAELQTVPGIGPVTAGRIIEYRSQVKRIKTPEELLQIPGIGPCKYKKISPHISVR